MDSDNSLGNHIYSEYLIAAADTKVEVIRPDPEAAMEFYKKHLLDLDPELDRLCRRYNFKSQLPPWKWEMFAAILMGDRKAVKTESDLTLYEVKSAGYGNSFEYQYHKKKWQEKLRHEREIGHLFISYWPGYRNFEIRHVPGARLAEIFDAWLPYIEEIYQTGTRNKRCRRQIPFNTVVTKGDLILVVEETKIVYEKCNLLNTTSSVAEAGHADPEAVSE